MYGSDEEGRSPGFVVLFSLVVALAVGVSALEGQGADRNRMTTGDSVRVEMSGRMSVAASFNRWRPDAILLDVDGFAQPYRIELSEMERLDVYMRRTRRESFRHGALLGAAGGIFIGAVMGLALHKAGVIDDADAPPAEIVTDAIQWSGIGLVGGALVGGFYAGSHPGLGWIRVQLPGS